MTRSTFNEYFNKILFAVGFENYKRYPQQWKEYMTLRTSSRAKEESGYVAGFGYLVAKPEATGFSYDSMIQGPIKSWVHTEHALAARISQVAIEDDEHGIMKQAAKNLTTSAAATMHKAASRMIMTGTATTYHTAGDGKALFASDHIRLDGGSWSNLGTAATPTEASITAAIQNFESITDHRGKKYDQKAKAIICGPSLEFTIKKLLNSTQEPGTANNAVNSLNFRSLKLIIDNEITDDRWVVMGDKDEDIGFIHFDRIKPTMSRHGDPDTGDVIYSIRCRFSNECNDPRSMYMIPAS
jgi:phage major head subunit gpT-like protein